MRPRVTGLTSPPSADRGGAALRQLGTIPASARRHPERINPDQPTVRRFLKGFLVTLAVLVGLFGLMQLVPYGRTHSNPPINQEPVWDSPRTRELTVRACYDCHSNETRWPWYAKIAPFSWVVQRDVEAARSVINFSEWNLPFDLASYSSLSVRTRGMPPTSYRLAHPEAALTDEEIQELARGLDLTLKKPGQR